jgi:ATP-dependent RNA helicase DeaD
MLGRARVQAMWVNPPTAEEIRALDRQRLLQDPVLTEAPAEDDYTFGDTLLETHGVREIAAALSKLLRSKLPPPEEIEEEAPYQPHSRHERGPKPDRERRAHDGPRHEHKRDERKRERPTRAEGPRAPRNEMTDGVWFRVNVGRERNADPKWLLPEICRQGEITKKEVGAIRVEDTQTLIQIDARVAESFAEKVAARTKGGVRIMPGARAPEPVPPAAAEPRPTGKKPFHQDKSGHPKKGGKPFHKWNKGPGAKLKRGGSPHKPGKPAKA